MERRQKAGAQRARCWWKEPWLFALLLVAATILVYLPAWNGGGFVWDDDVYVTKNPLLSEPDGLWRIWFTLDSPSQYFPLAYTTLRFEHALWGLNPAGYHWVNILIHAANALLVWRLLKALGAPGARLAAAIFALHPVQVESVAWISELKNVECLLFYLLALLAWVVFVKEQPRRLWRYYALALGSYALALASKSPACTLPAAMLLVLWLKRRPITLSRVAQVVPFVVLGLGMGLVAMWWERYQQGTQGAQFEFGPLERILIASRAVWFYAGKLLWPMNLAFSYPCWPVNPSAAFVCGWLAAGAGLGGVIWYARRWAGRSVEVAALFYVAALAPYLGFIMEFTFRYTFVADHYQYIASIGPIALIAAGLVRAAPFADRWLPHLSAVTCGALLLGLGALTWRQSAAYADKETLWQATLAANPDAGLAHNNLGVILRGRGQLDEALAHYQRAVECLPQFHEAHNNLGNALLDKGQVDEAIVEFQKALELKPLYAEAHNNLANALLQKGQAGEAIAQYQKALEIEPDYADARCNLGNALLKQGRVHEAMAQYEAGAAAQPQNAGALNLLAWMLATCWDASVRNGTRAVALAERACALTGFHEALIVGTLAAAYAEEGRFEEAVATAEKAKALAAAAGQNGLAQKSEELLQLYRAGKPYHKAAPNTERSPAQP